MPIYQFLNNSSQPCRIHVQGLDAGFTLDLPPGGSTPADLSPGMKTVTSFGTDGRVQCCYPILCDPDGSITGQQN